MEALPKVCDYSEPMGILPSGTENFSVTNYAINGSTFTPGQQIIVDLNNVGYLDPDSLIIRYKIQLTIPTQAAAQANGTSYSIPGCPVYTPILRLDTLFNSNVVESINNYNSVATALSNLQYSMSDKMGMQSGLGYYEQSYGAVSVAGVLSNLTDYSTTNENTDGLTVVVVNAAATTSTSILTYWFSAPLPCLLSNAEKLVPLNGTNIRLQFTLDALSNICPTATTTVGTTAPTQGGAFSALSISNFEVVYNQIQFPPQVERQMLSMPKIRIKTSSYATGLQTLAAGISGTANLVYNLRYASIKAMVLLLGSSSANATSKLLESIDLTSGNGSYNFQVNGVYYPQNPLSTVNNRSGVLMELRNAMRDMYSGNNSMAIDNSEFLAIDTTNATMNQIGVGTTATKINIPAKFYVGASTRKMNTSALFTGISSQNSPITAIINTGTATALAYSPILMLFYDAIIEIDTLTKQVNYIY
jgi:hypothetical protein